MLQRQSRTSLIIRKFRYFSKNLDINAPKNEISDPVIQENNEISKKQDKIDETLYNTWQGKTKYMTIEAACKEQNLHDNANIIEIQESYENHYKSANPFKSQDLYKFDRLEHIETAYIVLLKNRIEDNRIGLSHDEEKLLEKFNEDGLQLKFYGEYTTQANLLEDAKNESQDAKTYSHWYFRFLVFAWIFPAGMSFWDYE